MLAFLLLSSIAHGDIIHTCNLKMGASITWEESKPGAGQFRGKAEPESQPEPLIFIEKKKDATIKGNGGQTQLKRIGPHSFTETSPVGNINLWTLLEKTDAHPTVLVQHKAYDAFGATSYTTAFLCN